MCVLPRHRRSVGLLTPPTCAMQIRDLNSGTFGFVQLAKDKQTGELVACKFIERGDKVCCGFCLQHGGFWGPARGPWGLAHQGAADPAVALVLSGVCWCPCRSPSMWSARSSTTGALCTLTSSSSRR